LNVEKVLVHLFVEKLERPITNALAIGAEVCTIACQVFTNEGIVGEGYGWSVGYGRGRLIASAVREASVLMLGEDPLRIEGAWRRFWDFSNFIGHAGLTVIGMSVIDMALWDIRCKSTSTPLWVAVGGHRDHAPIYSSDLADRPLGMGIPTSELVDAAEALIQQGFTTFKTFTREPYASTIQLNELASALGPDIRLALDFVQACDANTAIRACQAVEDTGLLWIEDPTPFDDLDGTAVVASALRTPVCTGEQLYNVYEVRRLLEQTSVRYLNIDLQRCGGITGWIKFAHLAEAYGVEVAAHGYPHIGAHLVSGTRNAVTGESLPWWDRIAGPRSPVEAGQVKAPAEPGIGIHLDPSALERSQTEIVTA
jgi:L-alanine-DL-glutamate epimerase-like enolase superfamily enzyme